MNPTTFKQVKGLYCSSDGTMVASIETDVGPLSYDSDGLRYLITRARSNGTDETELMRAYQAVSSISSKIAT